MLWSSSYRHLLAQGHDSRQGKGAVRQLSSASWRETAAGFYHRSLLLCSYNSPLNFGAGTRLTVTGMGSDSRLGGVPVFDHGDGSLGGQWGVRTGSEPPFPAGARGPSPPCREPPHLTLLCVCRVWALSSLLGLQAPCFSLRFLLFPELLLSSPPFLMAVSSYFPFLI